PTNIQFVRTVLGHPEFVKGNVYTDFIPDYQKELFADVRQSDEELVEGALGLALLSRPRHPTGPFEQIPFFRLNHAVEQKYKLGEKDVALCFLSETEMEVSLSGQKKRVSISDVSADENGVRYTIEFDGRRWSA
ncbi:hypothetical protein ANCCAN_30120, partial [Ancylostoma caninum]